MRGDRSSKDLNSAECDVSPVSESYNCTLQLTASDNLR